jgi:hypothetical protein
MVVCSFTIRGLLHKFTIDSISIVASNDYVKSTDIPFPAVTILSFHSFKADYVNDYVSFAGIRKINGTIICDTKCQRLKGI